MAGIGDLLGGKGKDVAEQLVVWGVLNQLISAVLTPEFTAISRVVNKLMPATPLSPSDLADMVVRNIIDEAAAQDYASQSGVRGDDFQRMVHNAGDAPSPTELILALRRQVIPEHGTGPDATSYEQGIAESRLYNKWGDMIKELANVPIAPAEAVDAVVEGQISFEEGAQQAYYSGVSRADFQILVNTRGNPPSPGELGVMMKRGLIPRDGTGPDATSFQQGIYEGATKDKWWELLAAIQDYRPPMRTIVTMVHHGVIDDATALKWFHQLGADDQVANAMLADAHATATTTHKELTATQVVSMYVDGLMSQSEAETAIVALGFPQAQADLLLQHGALARQQTTRNQGVSRIRTMYLNRALNAASASAALDKLGVPHDARDQLLATWQVELDNSKRSLTEAQVAAALYYQIIDQPTAMAQLVAMGFSSHDAWVVLSVRAHGKLPNEP